MYVFSFACPVVVKIDTYIRNRMSPGRDLIVVVGHSALTVEPSRRSCCLPAAPRHGLGRPELLYLAELARIGSAGGLKHRQHLWSVTSAWHWPCCSFRRCTARWALPSGGCPCDASSTVYQKRQNHEHVLHLRLGFRLRPSCRRELAVGAAARAVSSCFTCL